MKYLPKEQLSPLLTKTQMLYLEYTLRLVQQGLGRELTEEERNCVRSKAGDAGLCSVYYGLAFPDPSTAIDGGGHGDGKPTGKLKLVSPSPGVTPAIILAPGYEGTEIEPAYKYEMPELGPEHFEIE